MSEYDDDDGDDDTDDDLGLACHSAVHQMRKRREPVIGPCAGCIGNTPSGQGFPVEIRQFTKQEMGEIQIQPIRLPRCTKKRRMGRGPGGSITRDGYLLNCIRLKGTGFR